MTLRPGSWEVVAYPGGWFWLVRNGVRHHRSHDPQKLRDYGRFYFREREVA